MNCLSPETLQALLDGTLAQTAQEAAFEHLRACPSCRAMVPENLVAPVHPTLATQARSWNELVRGDMVGRYVVTHLLGRGKTGVVYAAHDPRLDRQVSIKLHHAGTADQDHLLQEAQAMARLSHPNVAAIHDVGMSNGCVFVAMERLDGTTLAQWLESAPRNWQDLLIIFADAGRGLAAAHGAGLVHGALDLDCIHIDKTRRVRVSQFSSGGRTMSASNRVPTVDSLEDQFQFCAMFRQALYVNTRDKEAPGWLDSILRRGMHKDPQHRHASMDALLLALHQGSVRKQRMSKVALVMILVCVAAGLVAHELNQRERTRCSSGQDRLAGVWDGSQQERIQHAFLAVGKPYSSTAWLGVKSSLDTYARSWLSMNISTCLNRLGGVTAAAVQAAQERCLEQRLLELQALTRLFAAADTKVVENSASATATLTSPDGCKAERVMGVNLPVPYGTEAQKNVAEIRSILADSMAQYVAGQSRQALALAKQAQERADVLDYAPVEAEAQLRVGQMQHTNGDYEAAQASVERALLLAEAIPHEEVVLLGWTLMLKVQVDRGRFDDGFNAAQHAEALLKRTGGNPAIAAEIAQWQGHAYRQQQRWDEAEEKMQEALVHLSHVDNVEDITIANTRNALATVYSGKGRLEQALEMFQDVQQTYEKHYGSDHAVVAMCQNNIANVRIKQGRFGEAVKILQKALASAESAWGPNHAKTGRVLNNLGAALRADGQLVEAESVTRRSLEILKAALGANHPSTILPLCTLGRIQWAQGHRALGMDTVNQCFSSTESSLGKDHIRNAEPLTSLGQMHLALGETRKAVPLLERALSLRSFESNAPAELAETRFALAQALLKTQKDRALHLAAQAHDGFVSQGDGWTRHAAEVQRWLHDVGVAPGSTPTR